MHQKNLSSHILENTIISSNRIYSSKICPQNAWIFHLHILHINFIMKSIINASYISNFHIYIFFTYTHMYIYICIYIYFNQTFLLWMVSKVLIECTIDAQCWLHFNCSITVNDVFLIPERSQFNIRISISKSYTTWWCVRSHLLVIIITSNYILLHGLPHTL